MPVWNIYREPRRGAMGGLCPFRASGLSFDLRPRLRPGLSYCAPLGQRTSTRRRRQAMASRFRGTEMAPASRRLTALLLRMLEQPTRSVPTTARGRDGETSRARNRVQEPRSADRSGSPGDTFRPGGQASEGGWLDGCVFRPDCPAGSRRGQFSALTLGRGAAHHEGILGGYARTVRAEAGPRRQEPGGSKTFPRRGAGGRPRTRIGRRCGPTGARERGGVEKRETVDQTRTVGGGLHGKTRDR